MAFPFKTGGDFYNCEALNMRLHNHSADLNEYGTGTIYFNTGSNTNHSKHAVVHDGTNFKALAFVDEIATNAEFVELKEKVDLLIGDDVDTDTIIDSWKEVQAFLADIEDTKTLQGMLSSYLPKSGGTITGPTSISARFKIINGAILEFVKADETSVMLRGNPSSAELQYYNGTIWNDVIHSGNIGSYALKIDGTNARPILLTPYENLNDYAYGYYSYVNGNDPENKYGTNAALFAFRSYRGNDTWQIAFDGNDINNTAGPNFAIRGNFANSGWTEWYRIATTSGNVASATKLQTARTIWGQSFDGTGDVNGSLIGTNFLIMDRASNPYLKFTENGLNGFIQFWDGAIFIGPTSSNSLLVNNNGNVLIGTTSELKSGAKLQIKGDVYVDGNIIATKEVSAGGAGQEGESGDGGAEVLAQQLAKGQSTYSITNTIGRSDIAVSLYEWNANNSSWDMCLADISVKDATITITFGSATSVNHKIVAVG